MQETKETEGKVDLTSFLSNRQEDFKWLYRTNMKNVIHSFMADVTIIETGPLISFTNQYTGFYMIGTPLLKELMIKS